jgi:hypothetical protein
MTLEKRLDRSSWYEMETKKSNRFEAGIEGFLHIELKLGLKDFFTVIFSCIEDRH